ncbi:MAG: hypothetical protein ACK553_02670 [Planctomycetota bacterium]
MFRFIGCAVVAVVSLTAVSACQAQWPANIPNSTSGKTNAWTFRDGNRAIAFYIEDTSGNLTGKLCMYKFNTARNLYERVAIKIDTLTSDTIDVSLTAHSAGKGLQISTNTASLPSNPVIGWVSAGPGNAFSFVRWTSTVRFEGAPIQAPCEAPPTDDVGEEEEIPSQGSTSKSPGQSIPKVAGRRPTPSTSPSP